MIQKMNPEVKALWVEALESGEYPQCKGALTKVAEDGSESHCCLGVLTELAVKAGVIERERVSIGGLVVYGDGERSESTVTPGLVMAWAGLTHSVPDVAYKGATWRLASLNDGEEMEERALEFPEIAKLIREQL